MNLSEVNWDFNASGTWPLPVKAAGIGLVAAIVLGVGIYYDSLEQWKAYEALQKKELDLKQNFETKYKKAVNLPDYQAQLTQIEAQLFEMIRQMPTKEEVANLLTDISQTGLASGLEFRLFKPGPSIAKDFYSELPINIEVVGRYEELGLFVSGLAALPRIVTVHDINIVPMDKDVKSADKNKDKNKDGRTGLMVMKAVVKTYNESTGVVPEKTDPKKAKAKTQAKAKAN